MDTKENFNLGAQFLRSIVASAVIRRE